MRCRSAWPDCRAHLVTACLGCCLWPQAEVVAADAHTRSKGDTHSFSLKRRELECVVVATTITTTTTTATTATTGAAGHHHTHHRHVSTALTPSICQPTSPPPSTVRRDALPCRYPEGVSAETLRQQVREARLTHSAHGRLSQTAPQLMGKRTLPPRTRLAATGSHPVRSFVPGVAWRVCVAACDGCAAVEWPPRHT